MRDKADDRTLAAVVHFMDQHHVALSVLAQGEDSLHMTDEFKEQLAKAKDNLAPYTVAAREKE